MIHRRTILGGLAASAILARIRTVHAQADYPSRPVTVVVPFGAGGSTDTFARVLAQRLATEFSQPFTVDNRFGASGTVGAATVVRSRPDGYTLLLTTISSYAMAPNLMQVPYDNERGFAAVGLVAAQPMIMVVGKNHPARTLADYVALARANPGKETFANAGAGSSTHLAAELFFQEARLDVLDVGYRGSGPAIQAVASGESGMLILAASALMGFIKSGELRPLAVASAQRASLAPEVPTFAEGGFPAVVVREDMALLAPAGTPDAILDRLNAVVIRAMDAPEARDRLATLGIEPGVRSRSEWPDYLRAEVSRWGTLIKARNIRVQ